MRQGLEHREKFLRSSSGKSERIRKTSSVGRSSTETTAGGDILW